MEQVFPGLGLQKGLKCPKMAVIHSILGNTSTPRDKIPMCGKSLGHMLELASEGTTVTGKISTRKRDPTA